MYPLLDGIPSFVLRPVDDSSFAREHFGVLARMEEAHFWHRGRREILASFLKSAGIASAAGARILEIGCGNGNVLRFLEERGFRVEGCDLHIEALRYCRRFTRAGLYQADAARMPFASGQFDVVGTFDVLEHIEDDAGVLKEMFRVCRSGGLILVTVPAHRRRWSSFDVVSKHQRRYEAEELRDKIRGAGFVQERISFFMFLLYPLFLVARGAGDFLRPPFDSRRLGGRMEMRTIPVLNTLLLAILTLEKAVLRWISLPTGASLIALARKPL
jgi:SAM-dependent methyltransferase